MSICISHVARWVSGGLFLLYISAHTGFVLDALELALHDRRPVHRGGLVHHSDRGSVEMRTTACLRGNRGPDLAFCLTGDERTSAGPHEGAHVKWENIDVHANLFNARCIFRCNLRRSLFLARDDYAPQM